MTKVLDGTYIALDHSDQLSFSFMLPSSQCPPLSSPFRSISCRVNISENTLARHRTHKRRSYTSPSNNIHLWIISMHNTVMSRSLLRMPTASPRYFAAADVAGSWCIEFDQVARNSTNPCGTNCCCGRKPTGSECEGSGSPM